MLTLVKDAKDIYEGETGSKFETEKEKTETRAIAPIRISGINMALDFEDCWQKVLSRDVQADGTFVYGVRSTGIYCRPSCPSRRPRREQASFFELPIAAEQAGFRACRRCQPQESEPGAKVVEQACRYIEANLESNLTLADLGQEVSLSPNQLLRNFKRVLGITPKQYTESLRVERLKTGLREGQAVSEAQNAAGYSSSSRLYENATGQLGMTPAVYRRGGKGLQITYTITDCVLGKLLVATTDKGLCSVTLGENPAELEATLRREYPAADIRSGDGELNQTVTALLEYLNGQRYRLDLPLDVQATAFQRQVWEMLRTIPYGNTRSYGQVAVAIGQPTAARAVARACATNPVALVTPCHRVVREDGSMGGYRWGIERKQFLLNQEAELQQRRVG